MTVKIPIVTTFSGKGISQADKALAKLGKTFAAYFGTRAIINFGKESVKAFAANEKSAAILANTLKNTGQAFRDLPVENFIANLSMASGVIKEDLRPEFQKLYLATGSVATAQKALTTALDVSKGTGKDLGTVTTALSKAYLGNYTSLTRLGAGLDKTLIKSQDMNAIMEKLTTNFGGATATAAQTFAGQLAILNVALTDSKEIIGKGLVDSLKILAGDSSIETVAKNMEKFAQSISDTTVGIALLTNEIKKIPGLEFFGKIVSMTNAFTLLRKLGAEQRISTAPAVNVPLRGLSAIIKADAKAKIDAAKKVTAATNKQTAAQKKAAADALALSKAKSVFDLNAIELYAALKNTTDKIETERLLALSAIQLGNVDLAAKYSDLVLKAQAATGALGAGILALPKEYNPFADFYTSAGLISLSIKTIQAENPFFNWGTWAANAVSAINAELAKIKMPTLTTPTIVIPAPVGGGNGGGGGGGVITKVPDSYVPVGGGSGSENSGGGLPLQLVPVGGGSGSENSGGGRVNVTVNVAGSVSTQQDLVDAITQGILDNSQSGIQTAWFRSGGTFASTAI